jgi:hypothetical protein
MVFCCQTRTFPAVSPFVHYDNGFVDECFWNDVYCLSFFELNNDAAYRIGDTKDLQAAGNSFVNETDMFVCHAIMVY